MALIDCPECGKSVSDRADNCIHCGFPLQQKPLKAAAAPEPKAWTATRPAAEQPEKVFLEQGSIKVTNARFIAGAQTFAVQNITSVTSARDPDKYGWAFIWLLVMIGCFIGGAIAGGLFFLACAGVVIYRQMTRPTYVMLHTAGGENKAYSSTDELEIATIVNAVNQAIVHRG